MPGSEAYLRRAEEEKDAEERSNGKLDRGYRGAVRAMRGEYCSKERAGPIKTSNRKVNLALEGCPLT